jgi:hypothetical protein
MILLFFFLKVITAHFICVEILNKSQDGGLSNHIVSKFRNLTTTTITNEHRGCVPDNITIIPDYHTSDSLSYQVSRCNYCGKEWGEFWVSYRYIFSSFIHTTSNASNEESI